MSKTSYITNIKKVTPTLSKCISVDSKDKLFVVGDSEDSFVATHNSVGQRLIINSCIMRPEKWRFFGIDLKRVELSIYRPYSNVVLKIATTLEDAVDVLRFASQTMMKRYTEMEALGLNNYEDIPDRGHAVYVMVDEGGELLTMGKNKSLVASTLVNTVDGNKPLEDIQIGDVVYDNEFNECYVTDKYEPFVRQPYKINFKNCVSGVVSDFIAGDEHLWECILQNSVERKISTLTTEQIYNILENNKNTAGDKTTRVFVRRRLCVDE